jgi:diguanylate cyclase (GGDEF)-like protein/PAS domain S-box-containing protein
MRRRKRSPGSNLPRLGEPSAAVRVDPRAVDACGPTPRLEPAGSNADDDVARRYRTLVEQLPLVVYVDALDAISSNIFTSAQVEPLLGYTVEEWLEDANLFARTLHPDDRDRVLAAHARTHATNEPLSVEYRLIAKDGRVVWIRDEGVVVFDESGRPLHLQGYMLDITPEREAQEQLRQMALYDTLTGLANRAFFHEQFQHTVSIRKAPEQQTAVLFIDLDGFKNVNDRWGHDVGDKVLATLGRRINEALRAGDVAARLGGDEFAVVIPSIEEPAEAVRVTERLLEAIAAPIEFDHANLSVSASIGISVGGDVQTMLQEADAAMYRAKAHQDVSYAFFETALDAAALRRSKRLIELREAVELGQFTLDYQPLVDLAAHEITGYEALLRWLHPTEGVVAPMEFIPLAEESGLIVQLGKWVLEEACRYGAVLHEEMGRETRMAVNVSARQLQHPDFASHVEAALAKSGFPARCLTLELTESVLLANGEHTGQRLEALKSRGIALALDDFGTGYASLSYLQRFPVDMVKIDRSFVKRIESATADLMLLKGIVDLGEALGLSLVAEGIETAEQFQIVRDLGCLSGQGFYFGHPAAHPVRKLADNRRADSALSGA